MTDMEVSHHHFDVAAGQQAQVVNLSANLMQEAFVGGKAELPGECELHRS